MNRGALRRGLLLCRSNLVPEWRGEKSRAEAAGPDAEKPDAKPTSSGVSGGGRKLSKTGLRMRPSLAYLAEEKYCGSARECFRDVQRNVGSRRIDLRFPCMGAADAGRKGDASGMVGGRSHGVWSARPGAGCSGGGGVSSGGGGDDDELCGGGALCRADSFRAARGPKLRSDTENRRLRRSLPSSPGGWGIGSGACTSGGSPRASGSACTSSEAWESEEVSTLGLLDREESEDTWEEC